MVSGLVPLLSMNDIPCGLAMSLLNSYMWGCQEYKEYCKLIFNVTLLICTAYSRHYELEQALHCILLILFVILLYFVTVSIFNKNYKQYANEICLFMEERGETVVSFLIWKGVCRTTDPTLMPRMHAYDNFTNLLPQPAPPFIGS